MHKEIRAKIEKEHGLSFVSIEPAPRSFVAQTWFASTKENKYFIKIVDKPLFIPEIIKSLPVVDAMHKAGITSINWPIQTISEELYTWQGNSLIVIFNYIDAVQSYDYSDIVLGELLANIHKITPQVKVAIPEDNYEYEYKERFESQYHGIITGELATEQLLVELQKILQIHQGRIDMQYQRLSELAQEMTKLNLGKVITHGDAGGNTLVKNPETLFLIDWDQILLSPPERDMWVPSHKFFAGYRKIIPDFSPNHTSLAFYTLMYYFRSIAHIFAEVISTKPEEHRIKNLQKMEDYLGNGWITPHLKKAKAF